MLIYLKHQNNLLASLFESETMLGYESENRLKKLLVAVGDGERGLEAAR